MKILNSPVHPCIADAFTHFARSSPHFSIDAAAEFIESVVTGGQIRDAVNHELRTTLANNLYESPFWTTRGLVLVAAPSLILAVDKVPAHQSRVLSSLSQDAVVMSLTEGVHYDRYAMPAGKRLDVLDPDAQLVFKSQAMVCPGTPLAVRAEVDVIDFYAPGEQRYLVKAMSPVKLDFTWSFDRTSLKPWNISGAHLLDDQIMTALEALEHLGGVEHAGTIEHYLDARSHHVRWKALQTLNAVAPERALLAFDRFLTDPHPHIRKAASEALN